MAFRKKWHAIIDPALDILVVQECEHPSKFVKNQIIPNYNEFLWYGDNEHKGLGIITFNDYHVRPDESHLPEYRYIIPYKIEGPTECHLYSIWAMPHKKRSHSYVGQIWRALQHYEILEKENNILIGDFNSNAIWDRERRHGNHSDVVRILEEKAISSIYHSSTKEEHGSEQSPTLYLLKQLGRPFHMDYCFASQRLINKSTKIAIGKYQDWIHLSDHMPVWVWV